MLDYLILKYSTSTYVGIDISEEMIKAAQIRHIDKPQARFIVSSEPDQIADYSFASGIFNVRLDRSDNEWLDYIKSTIKILDRFSNLGFAFNCLTSFADEHKKQRYLYYANPLEISDFCKTHFSSDITLLSGYGLYEFTILVRKLF
jgi:hypothetical protein